MAQCLTCDKRLLDEYHGDEIAAELLRVADVISEPTPTRSPGRSPPTSPNSKTRSSAATRGYCATTAPTTTFPAGSLPSSTTQHSPPTSPRHCQLEQSEGDFRRFASAIHQVACDV